MNPHFDDLLNALHESSAAMVQSHAAMTRAVKAAIEANHEHEDLRETVERLEATILDLVRRLNERGLP